MLKLLDITEICSTVHIIDSYNLLIDKKWLKKWLQQLTDQAKKKLKKYWKVGIELSINDDTKSSQIKILS